MTHPTPPPIGHHLRERRQASRRLELIDAQHKPNELCRGGRVIAHVLVSWYWRSSGLEKAKQKNKRTSARVNTPCTLQLPAKTGRMSCWWQINIYHNDQVLGSLPKLMDYCSLLHLLYFIGNSCQVPLSTKRDEPVFWNRQGSPNEFDACMHWVCMWTCICTTGSLTQVWGTDRLEIGHFIFRHLRHTYIPARFIQPSDCCGLRVPFIMRSLLLWL